MHPGPDPGSSGFPHPAFIIFSAFVRLTTHDLRLTTHCPQGTRPQGTRPQGIPLKASFQHASLQFAENDSHYLLPKYTHLLQLLRRFQDQRR